jgi:hypothetical protein
MRAWVVVLGACSFGDEPIAYDVELGQPLPAGLRVGDSIRTGGIELVVPESGTTVTIMVDDVDGATSELALEHPIDSAIVLVEPQEPLALAAGSTDPCSDGAFKLTGYRWMTPLRWKFHAASTPAANNKGNVETALQHAANAITSSRNSCGLADQVSAKNEYEGRTTRAPNISATATTVTCGNADGVNVVGFGALPSTTLAVACTWSVGKEAVESDLRFAAKRRWFALGVPAGCSNMFGIQDVGTHEFGHAFGLAHVSEAAHPNLTMSPRARPCTNADLSLGRGDVRGLRALY